MENSRQPHQIIEDDDPYAQAQKNAPPYPKSHLNNQAHHPIGSQTGQDETKDRHQRSKSRKGSKEPKIRKPTATEKYEEIRYSGFELNSQISQLIKNFDNVAPEQIQSNQVTIPLEIFLQMKNSSNSIAKDYQNVQDQWCQFFEEQIEVNQKQRGKSKNYRKKLKGLENQSLLFQKDQRDFEMSLKDITKEHDITTNKIEHVLDQMESQVNELKNTRHGLSHKLKYESQLDQAVKEMISFYNNLEGSNDNSHNGDYEAHCANLDRVFFIKPTHEIDLRIQQSASENSLGSKADANDASVPQMNYFPVDSQTNMPKSVRKNQQIVPKLKLNEINSQNNLNIILNSQNSNNKAPQINIEETDINSSLKAKKAEANDAITNPILIGAMNLESAYDPKLDDSIKGADITLDMNTERLAQFPEDYEMLKHIQNEGERILMKQMVFLKYEKLLRKQAKRERKQEFKEGKRQDPAEKPNTAQKSSGEKKIPRPEYLIPGGMNQALKSNAPTPSNKNDVSNNFISLQSELSPMNTIERNQAHFQFVGNDVNESEIVNIEEFVIDGLKSCTQLSLIEKISNDFKQKQQAREQIKKDEKKIDHNSSSHSIAIINKQLHSEQLLQNKYASNNSNGNGSNQMLINVDSEYSMNSDPKMSNQIKSNKNLPGSRNALDLLNVEVSLMEGDQSSINHQGSSSNDKSKRSHVGGKILSKDFEDESRISSDKKLVKDVSLPNLHNDINEQVNGSFLSGKSHYQRMFENQNQEGLSPSPLQIQNSYIQSSDQSIDPVDKNNDKYQFYLQNGSTDVENQPGLEQNYQDSQIQQQPQQLVDRIDDEVKAIRSKLALDVIPERQSEFSQSMITNANKMNTNRSRASRASKNQYANMSRLGTGQGNGGGTINSNLPTGRSEINKSSTRQKKGTNENLSALFNNEPGNFRKKAPLEIEDYKNSYVRSSSQAQTSRNQDSKVQKSSIISDEQIQLQVNSRNAAQKISKSSKDRYSLNQLPSADKNEKEVRQKFLSNFERDMSNLVPSFNMPNSKKKKKSVDKVPPLDKNLAKRDLNNNIERSSHHRNDNLKMQNGINLTEQNTQLNSERELMQQPQYQPHSHRSHIRDQGAESLRDRSYFDESPAIFDNPESADNQNSGIRHRSSQRRDTEIPQNTQTHQDNFYDNSDQLQGSDILMHMQSIPQTSINSASRDVGLKSKIDTESILQLKEVVTSETNEELPKDLGKNEMLDGISEQIQQKKETALPGLVRSSSECQFRDKQFYEMCDDDDEIAMYFKFAEQNLIDAIHVRNLSNYNTKKNPQLHNQSSDNQTSLFDQNKSSATLNNQLVFMSQQTFKRLLGGKYLQTQEKTQIAQQLGSKDTNNSQIIQPDQNSSQQQTRGKATIQKLCYDPNRLLASMNHQGSFYVNATGNGPQPLNNNYLGTNLLTTSLDQETIFMRQDQIMMPNHNYNRRTMLMMQNLHNNYLYSNNSGMLFTSQRGWNSGQGTASAVGNKALTNGGAVPQSLKTLTNIRAIDGAILNKNSSICDQNASQIQPSENKNNEKMNSLGGEPVNISSLLMGAKQQTTEQINVGCITIVDDDGKFMMDRKMLIEGNNLSHQTNARRLFSQSRNINGQVTTSDFSNLQTKQLGILRNQKQFLGYQNQLPVPNTTQNNNINFYPTSESGFKEEVVAFDLSEKPTPITNKQSSCLEISSYEAQDQSEAQAKQPLNQAKNQNQARDQANKLEKNKMMNLFNGLQQMKGKQNQQKKQTRSSTDMSIIQSSDQQNNKKIITGQRKLQTEKNSKLTSYRNQNNAHEQESQQSVSQGQITTVKGYPKKQITGGMANIQTILKNQQNQKNLNLSQSINSSNFITQSGQNAQESLVLKQQVLSGGNQPSSRTQTSKLSNKSIVKLKSKSQPKTQLAVGSKQEIAARNQEIIEEIRKLKQKNSSQKNNQAAQNSTGDINLQIMGKKNKMKLVQNIKTTQQNFNTLTAGETDQVPNIGMPVNTKFQSFQTKTNSQNLNQPIKKLGSFMKKGSYQGPQTAGQQYYVSQGSIASARNSASGASGGNSVSAVYMNANGKLCIKKKVLNQQLSQNQQMTTNSLI